MYLFALCTGIFLTEIFYTGTAQNKIAVLRMVFYRYRYCVPVSPFFSCTGILDPDVKGRYFQIMTSLLSREFSECLVFLSVLFLCVGVFCLPCRFENYF